MIRSVALQTLLALVLATPMAAQSFQPLAGCDCPTVSMDEAYRHADAVFSGTPISSDTVMNRTEDGEFKDNSIKYVKTKFRVERIWKGPGGPETEIFTFYVRDQCAYRFDPGMHYLLFAYMSNGMMVTDRCEPTRGMADVTPAFRDSIEQLRISEQ